jgi:tetratricopeptide (TPR) repeat protein
MDQPNRSAALVYQAGLAAYERGEYQKAVDLLAPLEGQRSLPATLARFYLGQSYLQLGIAALREAQHKIAAGHFHKAREINPESAELAKYIAACHMAAKRFELAGVELERGAQHGKRDKSLPIRLAHAFIKDGMLDRALQTLLDAISQFPHRAEYRKQLGLIYASYDRHTEAVIELQAAARLAPLDACIRKYLGLSFAACSRFDDSVEHLAVAQKLCPRDAHIGWLLALACDASRMAQKLPLHTSDIKNSNHDEIAVEELGDLITREPEFVEAFLSLPEAGVDAEVFGMLATVLERALARCPDYADLHFHCSRIYERLGRTDAAIVEAQQATTINPRYVQALIQLGRLYARTNCSVAAIDRLEQAIASGGDYPDVHFLIGEMYRERGDIEAARERYERALVLNANYRKARDALALLQAA